MPELTAIHIALLVVAAVVGAVIAWILRGNRAEQEKAAVSAGWQGQIEAQRREHERLVEQNKSLMDQVSHSRAQHTDAKNRAKELSLVVQEAFERRDELQREIKDIRGNLETVLSERDQLASSVQARGGNEALLREKDERIEKLTKELGNWQNRLPPLIERFRERNEEAERLEAELEEARARIRELEQSPAEGAANETRIEPVQHSEELTGGRDASNDAEDDGAQVDVASEGSWDEATDDPWGAAQDEDFEDVDEPSLSDDLEEDEDFEETDEPTLSDDLEEDEDFEETDEGPEADDLEETVVAAAVNEPGNSLDQASTRPGDRDDLKMIKGVGPAIEKTLNELGIFNFRQIADMSEYDIDRVARRLKGFHSRIHREDWIGQARALLDQAAHA